MPEFVAPAQGLASGVQAGIQVGQNFAQQQMQRSQLAMQADQMQQQRKQQEWENDFKVIASGLQLSQAKGISPESTSKILNESVAPLWKKWTGSDFPAIQPESVEDAMPLIKNLNALGKQASENKVDWQFAFTEANNQISQYHAGSAKKKEISDREKAALDSAMAPLKAGYESDLKNKQDKGNFYFVDSATREMFDKNMNPIAEAPEGATAKVIANPMMGSELSKRGALVAGSKNSVNQVRSVLTDATLKEIKAIKLTPGKIYSQMASSDAKKFYRHLFNAVGNELYIKTGATANPTEIEGRMIMYWPAVNDDLDDMKDRLSMLEGEVGFFDPGGAKSPNPAPGASGTLSPEDEAAAYLGGGQ